MKSADLYRTYNKKKSRECIMIYLMIAISLIISVAVSIAIPQIDHSIKKNIDKNAQIINGSDVKVSADVVNDELIDSISELEDNGIIKKSSIYQVYSSSLKLKDYNVYTMLLKGDYDINENEIILSSYTADNLGIKKGDILNVSGKDYTVALIEDQAGGVTKQAEQMGYCKVSDPEASGISVAGAVFLLESDEPKKVTEELSKINGDFECTTIDDQKESLKDQLSTNTGVMNMINTMCIIMSLISVLSSVFMIINTRKQDISVMKCLSIRSKDIKKALSSEIKRKLILPVIIGALLSTVIAGYLLGKKHIDYSPGIVDIVVGTIFFGVMYSLFIDIITLITSSIDPIAFLRDTKQNLSSNKVKIIALSVIYLVVALFVYSVFYIGSSSAFSGSMIIIVALVAFYFVAKLLITVISLFKHMNKTTKYALGHMKKNSSVTAILVVNLVLMGWFMMFGFNFDKVSSTSVKNDIKNKIDYSYLLVTNGDEIEATADAFRNDNIKFTVLHRSVGYVNNNDNIVRAEIGLIDKTDNKVVFNVSDGKSEEELQEGEVLVSTDFAEKNKIIIGDNVKFYIPDSSTNKTKEINVKAVGLYEAGNINPQTMVASEISDIAEINSDIFLISADNLDFMNNDKISKDVTVADISMVEDALEAMVGDYMFYFKNMCFICMVAVLIFILNMIFIEYYSNKEIVIIKAMGLSSKFLYKASYVKQVIVNVLGFASALGLYYIIVKFLLNSMMKAKPHLTIDVFIVPIIVFATIGILCSIVEHISITKNCTKYDMLREKE